MTWTNIIVCSDYHHFQIKAKNPSSIWPRQVYNMRTWLICKIFYFHLQDGIEWCYFVVCITNDLNQYQNMLRLSPFSNKSPNPIFHRGGYQSLDTKLWYFCVFHWFLKQQLMQRCISNTQIRSKYVCNTGWLFLGSYCKPFVNHGQQISQPSSAAGYRCFGRSP